MNFSFLFALILFFHGDNVATYTITKDSNNIIHITANLDAKDVALALNSDMNSIKKGDLENYFNEHVEYKINNQLVPFKVKKINLKNKHLIINYSLTKEIETITELQIKSTLLFEVNDKQSNVIQIRFDGMVRDFLINKQKPVLKVSL